MAATNSTGILLFTPITVSLLSYPENSVVLLKQFRTFKIHVVTRNKQNYSIFIPVHGVSDKKTFFVFILTAAIILVKPSMKQFPSQTLCQNVDVEEFKLYLKILNYLIQSVISNHN